MPEGEEAPPRGVRAAAIVRWAIIAAVGLVAAGTVVRACFGDAEGEARAATRWQCPMHPQIVQDHPGECPICGMDLVPVAEGAAPAGAQGGDVPGLTTVEISLERLQTSGVRTAKAEHRTLDPAVRTLGIVSADERRLADLTARVPGWLRAGKALAVGDPVRRGQLLASIESPDVLALTRELVAVRALGGSGTLGIDELAAPVRQRLELLGMPRGAIERIERSGRAVASLPVVSPVAGHVLDRQALPGSWVERGSPIYRVGDLSTVWVLGEVYARDLTRVAVGQAADVRIEGDAAPAAVGRVTYVYPLTDSATRTTRVRVELPNPDLRLRPGLFAEAEIHGAPLEGIVVPAEAVVDTGERRYVFVAKGGGRFEPRQVRPGVRVGDDVIVEEGIAAGEEIVTSGNFLVDSESRLRAAISGAPPGHAGHGGGAPPGATPAPAKDPHAGHVRPATGAPATAAPATAVPAAERWTCPMHPQVVRDRPGRCPICGMQLVRAGDGP